MEAKNEVVKAEELGVVSKGRDPFSMMDSLDDMAITNELKGRAMERWVYSFTVSGKKVEGLSVSMVADAQRELSKRGEVLRVHGEASVVQDPTDSNYVLVQVRAGRHVVGKDGSEATLDSVIGSKRQWLKMRMRDGSIVPDIFWFEKGVSKAERNAKLKLIPEAIKQAVIAEAKKTGAKIVDVGSMDKQESAFTDEEKEQASAALDGKPKSELESSLESGPVPVCPVCSNDMWDNRRKRFEQKLAHENGTRKAKPVPAFGCKNKDCKGVVWSYTEWLESQDA